MQVDNQPCSQAITYRPTFFIATIQIGVIVQVCYIPQASIRKFIVSQASMRAKVYLHPIYLFITLRMCTNGEHMFG